MNSQVLIIGGGLTGLTTAFNLASQGLAVSLIDQTYSLSPPPVESRAPAEQRITAQSNSVNSKRTSHAFPIVVPGFHHATQALLEELETLSWLTSSHPAQLEFISDSYQHFHFNTLFVPPPLHTLIRLLFFQGLSFRDRWALLTKLEQLWEGEFEISGDLHAQAVDSWLATLEQSEQARQNIWHPLCKFFLGSDATRSSAQYFKDTLIQCFLSARRSTHFLFSTYDEETLFLTPLRHSLTKHGVTFHPHGAATQLQYDSRDISGVRLTDGTTLTADIYISALPRRALMGCLPERLLAKFAYFSNFSLLSDSSALIAELEVEHPIIRPRLCLSSSMFDWIVLRPYSDGSSHATRVSCVATDKPLLLEKTDEAVGAELSTLLPSPLKGKSIPSRAIRITRNPYAFLSCQPNISVFRPLPKSPISNFFIAGPWTDTGLPPSRESSIVSANLCAKAVIDTLQYRVSS